VNGREPVRDECDARVCGCEPHESDDVHAVHVSDLARANDENGCDRHENARDHGRDGDDGHEHVAMSDQEPSAGVDKIA
jgi:hypothetical protein